MILLLLIALIVLISIAIPGPRPKGSESIRLPFTDRPIPLSEIKSVSLQDGLLTVSLGKGSVTMNYELLSEGDRGALMAIALRQVK